MTQRHPRSVVRLRLAQASSALQTIRPPRLAAAAIASMILAAPAVALQLDEATPAATPASAQELIKQLDSPVLSEREAATGELSVLNPDLTLPDLESALDDASLSPEQRIRLLNAAAGRFKTSPRGALGVSFGGFDEEGIIVAGTLPRYDSQNKLKAGDRIVSIDGIKVGMRQEIRALIISRDPGQTAAVLVSRGGQNVEVPVILGDFAELDPQQTRAISNEELARAWDIRRARLAQLHAPGVLKSPIDAAGWRRLDRQSRAAENRRVKAAMSGADDALPGAEPPQEAPQRIALGGRSRENAVDALADFDAIVSRSAQRRALSGRDPRGERILINPQVGQPQNIKQIVEILRGQIAQIDAALKRQDISRENRRDMEMQRSNIETQLKMLEELPPMQR
jgi:hypothetical protein